MLGVTLGVSEYIHIASTLYFDMEYGFAVMVMCIIM